MTWLFIHTIATFILVVSTIMVLRRLSVRLALVDHPDAVRKQHHGCIPLCGGIAIMTTFSFTSFFNNTPYNLGAAFWIALLLVTCLGAIDDRRPLPAIIRLAAQLAMSVALVGSLDISRLLLGMPLLGELSILLPFLLVIGILFVVGLINAWNMLDGVDGLAGGSAAIALIWLMLLASYSGSMEIAEALETLLVCLCGFLVFNMRSPFRIRASVFLGDAGSMALGLTVAYAILALASGSEPISFIALLWIVIVPVIDTVSLIIRRLLAHRNPMSADRWHFHHLLIDHGLTPGSTTSTILIVSAICGAIGYGGVLMNIPDEIMASGLVLVMLLHTTFILAATGHLRKSRGHGVGPRLRASRVKLATGAATKAVLERSGNADMNG
jgi:UDP-GlcNAc:undecaprenyl-phosphate GlcNAc-1-phosphate transferase